MKFPIAKYFVALTIGSLAFAGEAFAQALAPNAEILMAKQGQGMKKMKISGKDKVAEAVEVSTVSAYVFIDSPEAAGRLQELGVQVRHNYGEYLTAGIPVELLQAASEVAGVSYITLGNDANLLNDYSRGRINAGDVHANTGNQLPRAFTGKGVVVGMIDTGVEYGHINFRDKDGKTIRIRRVWEQNGTGAKSPEKFGYGAEFTTTEELMSRAYDSSMEYHGTHTMGSAAGSDMTSPYYGVAPEADLVFVSFKNDDASIADAIQYIFDYADEVDKPCVINMSLGEHTGPHNGTSALDRHIDALTGPGRLIVGSCGNEGQYRLHATETFTEEDTQLKTLLTFASGVSHKYHYVDIWGTAGTDFSVQFCVAQSLKGNVVWTSDAFDTSNPDQRTVIKAFYVEDVGVTGTLVMTGEVNPINGQPHVMIESSVEEVGDGRMAGIIVNGEAGQKVDMWNFSGHEFSSNGKRGWTDGNTDCTVGEIGGTARTIIPVGSYDGRATIPWTSGGYSYWSEAMAYDADSHSVFSSYGPTADGRIAPIVLAPGSPVVSSINKHAFSAMGMDLSYMTSGKSTDSDGRAYYYCYDAGTSMSAPIVTGTVALMLEANPALTPEQAREIIQTSSITDDRMGVMPNNAYGYGRLNTLECVRKAAATLGVDSPVADIAGAPRSAKAWVEGSQLYIAIDEVCAGATAYVYTTTGQLAAALPLTQSLSAIPADGWAKGVYIIRVQNGDVPTTAKIAL